MRKKAIAVSVLLAAASSYAQITFDNKGDMKAMISTIKESKVPAYQQVGKVSLKE